MRTVIVYRSYHHGNTKKLINAIVAAHPEVDLIDVDGLGKKETPDLSGYQLVGGLQEKHPTDLEIEAAAFYDALLDKFGETIAVQRAKRDAQDAYAAAHAKPGVAERVKDAAGKLGGKR